MVCAKAFEMFCEKSAVSVMARALMENAFSDDRLNEVFRENAELQREGDLPFSKVVDVMSLVVLQIRPSVKAAYQEKMEEIGVAVKSVYNKLSGIEPSVSRALVRDSAANLTSVLEALGTETRETQAGYRTKIIDGKHLNRTERRLAPLREINGAPLPGIVLAVLDADRRLVSDVILTEDGHAQERSLLDEVLETVQKGDLWIADRNFCTVDFLTRIAKRSAHFVIRRHANLPLENVSCRRRAGKSPTGAVYEQTAEIPATDGAWKVRVITVKLKQPTRDGDTEIVIVSNLPKKVSARRIAQLYRDRWTIEEAFHQVATALHGEIDALAYPKAALFGFCIALAAHNLLNVLKVAIAVAQDGDEEELSSYYLADEISAAYYGMMIVLPPPFWRKRYARLEAQAMAQKLLELAGNVKWARFRKTRRGPKKPPPNVGPKTNRNHVSTKRILEAAC
jgi:IS4 transposase